MKRILLVEDEENLHFAIKLNLEMEGFNVISIFNGKNAVSKFKEGRFDLIILDVMLPEMNGFDICEAIRLENLKVPILFLTAKSSNDDKIKGLKMADDYLTKPFNLKELLLRVKNLLKRSDQIDLELDVSTILIAGCSVDFNSFEIVDENNKKLSLTHKQIKLLKLFVDKQNEVISRQEILEKIWGYDVYPSSRTIDNFILMFRKIFEKNLPPSTHFKSIRGVGYKFTP
jgi:two-component system alkaline phosphatase synthesis response regulator PhoP